jgi:hypothetical protein
VPLLEPDFERVWLAKLCRELDRAAGEEVRRQVMRGSEGLSSQSDRCAVIDWSIEAMARLDSLVDEVAIREIMTGCACRYPTADLQGIREQVQRGGGIDLAHRMLQDQFESFLRDSLYLSDRLIEEIVGQGWGSAGVRSGSTIVATKIPKSGNLVEYLQEADPGRRRHLYCHCPRVRDALLQGASTLSPTYCYCGAGFYKGIWEEILEQPVEVEVLESVLQGDDLCRIRIHLPPDR